MIIEVANQHASGITDVERPTLNTAIYSSAVRWSYALFSAACASVMGVVTQEPLASLRATGTKSLGQSHCELDVYLNKAQQSMNVLH